VLYRHKILLTLLHRFGNRLEKIQLHKLLLILAQQQLTAAPMARPHYAFVPYQYGAFSFQLNADVVYLRENQLVQECNNHLTIAPEAFNNSMAISPTDMEAIEKLYAQFGKSSTDALIEYTYTQYPYFATNSKIVAKHLNGNQITVIQAEQERLQPATMALCSIGYEGKSIDEYLNQLIQAQIQVLVDVRYMPLSRKYGFSKLKLADYVQKLGMQYLHLPELGIPGQYRKNLQTQADYDLLFSQYYQKVLTETQAIQQEIIQQIETHQRIALTCFEQNICQCHRKPLAESVAEIGGNSFPVVHL
jgi:uncharacterized protein (DUF488 family)